MKAGWVCLCQALLYLGQSLQSCLHRWACLVYQNCSKKTVVEGVGYLMSLLFSNRKRPGLSEVTMIVFVNQMLLMISGDVERNPGPGKPLTLVVCSHEIYHFITDILTPEGLSTLVNELCEVRAKWYDLGVQLRMTTPDLDAIQTQYQNNPNMPNVCLRQMLSVWLTKEVPSAPTWQRVVDALSTSTINEPLIAERTRRH